MFWSKNMRMETMTAGRLEAHLAHTGVSMRLTTQGLGVLGAICEGSVRYSRPMPYLVASQVQAIVHATMEMVGPKFATRSLAFLLK
mmetsp:Transcript_11474/g.31858  ORF Transcript_11474/g.31858 Transcript_11474/m.31858 type:complete len:86 (-) Transcript_11474:875-1132(-)